MVFKRENPKEMSQFVSSRGNPALDELANQNLREAGLRCAPGLYSFNIGIMTL